MKPPPHRTARKRPRPTTMPRARIRLSAKRKRTPRQLRTKPRLRMSLIRLKLRTKRPPHPVLGQPTIPMAKHRSLRSLRRKRPRLQVNLRTRRTKRPNLPPKRARGPTSPRTRPRMRKPTNRPDIVCRARRGSGAGGMAEPAAWPEPAGKCNRKLPGMPGRTREGVKRWR